MSNRVAMYLRVSKKKDQTTLNQILELRQAIKRQGWTLFAVYEDKISGAKGRDERPEYKKLMAAVARKEFDVVAAWSVCRLGRSLQELLAMLSELHAKKVDLYLHLQGLDTTTPAGKAMFQMLGVFAEFERAMILERIKAGLERAKAEGKRLGRPRVGKDIEDKIRGARKNGATIHGIAASLKIGVSVVQRVIGNEKTK